MANKVKTDFLSELTRRYGSLRKLDKSQSLYEVGESGVRVYIRYSRLHGGSETFYGLREEDLRRLEGHPAIICFLWDGQAEPLLVPFSEYEDAFGATSPAGDGQYKVQVYVQSDGTDLYIARAGRFNVEGHLGWGEFDALVDSTSFVAVPELSHSQVQTLLGAIGAMKGYDIWMPQNDRAKADWSLTGPFGCRAILPEGYGSVQDILQEVDMIWVQRGSSELKALFEVEHSTPIYSGLLRFNDVHLVAPGLRPRFSVVANNTRRSLFIHQLNRPTFRMSGLAELCTFIEYANVFTWYHRIKAA